VIFLAYIHIFSYCCILKSSLFAKWRVQTEYYPVEMVTPHDCDGTFSSETIRKRPKEDLTHITCHQSRIGCM